MLFFGLVRQTWAAHSARAVRTVGLPTMHEDSPSEPGIPSALAPSRSMSSGGGSDFGGESSGPPASERLSRTGSTSVMSVSEFYGPSGARMLQRRGSAASYASLAESYGEGEAALSRLMSLEGEQQQQKKTDSVAGEALGVMGVGATPTVKQTSPAVACTTNPWSNLPWPGQPPLLPGSGEAMVPATTTAPAGDPPRSSSKQAFLAPTSSAATEASASAVSDTLSLASRPVLPPPLTLEAPHPAGRNVSLPWMNAPPTSTPVAQAVVNPGRIAGQSHGSIYRTVSMDSGCCASAPSPAPGTMNLARSVSNPGSSGGARSTASVGIAHSPRLRAKSMDASSGGRKKGKGKKGPGSAVMGKADKIGRMLQVRGISAGGDERRDTRVQNLCSCSRSCRICFVLDVLCRTFVCGGAAGEKSDPPPPPSPDSLGVPLCCILKILFTDSVFFSFLKQHEIGS